MELSIVLVILGLLVGGVLSGQSLIHAAELRKITTQSMNYISAAHSFRDKYFQLPGDMNNATSFWGSSGGSGSVSDYTCMSGVLTSVSGRTCNGTGDGKLGDDSIPCYNAIIANYESTLFWHHLSNAGLVSGVLIDPIHGPSPTSLNSSLWSVAALPTCSDDEEMFDGAYGNVLVLSGAGHYPGLLKAEDMWNIDTKVDDGKPATGKMVIYSSDNDGDTTHDLAFCTSTSDTTDMNATYLLTSGETKYCALILRNPF